MGLKDSTADHIKPLDLVELTALRQANRLSGNGVAPTVDAEYVLKLAEKLNEKINELILNSKLQHAENQDLQIKLNEVILILNHHTTRLTKDPTILPILETEEP